MDIDLFSKCLKNLILENDIVNIPGLGCFIATLMPASFSDKGTTINPPYRKLSFRAIEREDGGLFLAELSSLLPQGTSAEAELSGFVEDFKADLCRKKSIRLDGLGTMRATAQKVFFFVSEDELDIYPAGFGLEPVTIRRHETAAKAEPEVVTPEAEVAAVEAMAAPVETETEAKIEPVAQPEAEALAEPMEEEPEEEQTLEEKPQAEPETEQNVRTEEASLVAETEPDLEAQAAETEAESGPEAASDDDREAARILEQAPGREQSRRSPGRTILYILLGLVIAVVAFVVMFHDALWFDALLDKLLYTEEELELLRSVL